MKSLVFLINNLNHAAQKWGAKCDKNGCEQLLT